DLPAKQDLAVDPKLETRAFTEVEALAQGQSVTIARLAREQLVDLCERFVEVALARVELSQGGRGEGVVRRHDGATSKLAAISEHRRSDSRAGGEGSRSRAENSVGIGVSNARVRTSVAWRP